MAAFVEHGVFFNWIVFDVSNYFLGNTCCQFFMDEWRDIACFNKKTV